MQKKAIFEWANSQFLALTYADIRLRTGYSETMPDAVSIESRFSRNVPLKIPIVSAAMDTVTEFRMGIEMAKQGGLAIIHKNLTPKDQAWHVGKVKHHLNGLIEKPIIVRDTDTVQSVLEMRDKKGYQFHSFPIIDNDGKLVGIVTEQDFDQCRDCSKPMSHIMSQNPVSAKKGTSINEAYEQMIETKKKLLPIIDGDGKVAGMYVWSDVKRLKTDSSHLFNLDAKNRLRVGAAVGVYDDALARLEELLQEDVDVIVIDTAHADTKSVIETLKMIKKSYSIDVVVGNISEAASCKRLVEAGADGIKVGQGPGSICTTRIVAGIGSPQASAVYNCVMAAGDCPVNADGGIVYTGDVPVAIGCGAESVMMGKVLAGTKEAPGDVVFYKGKQWKMYRGMGSLSAMKDNPGSRERYNQSGKSPLVPEGIEGLVEYAGEVAAVIAQYIGGLRKGMGYVGAATIKEMREKGDFCRITQAGKDESHPHDVEITRDAPNYAAKSNQPEK